MLFIIAVIVIAALQSAGPFLFGFSNWCNVIQYTSGFQFIGLLAFGLDYVLHHRPRIKQIHSVLHNDKQEGQH